MQITYTVTEYKYEALLGRCHKTTRAYFKCDLEEFLKIENQRMFTFDDIDYFWTDWHNNNLAATLIEYN